MNKTIGPAEDSAHHDLHAHRISQEAAREMLDVLKELKHFIGYVAFKDRDKDWGKVLEKAKAAIARAEVK